RGTERGAGGGRRRGRRRAGRGRHAGAGRARPARGGDLRDAGPPARGARARQLRRHRGHALAGPGARDRQPPGPRAPGARRARAAALARARAARGGNLPRAGHARGVRRLPGRTEPRPADGRDGALRLAARGLRLRQADEHHRGRATDDGAARAGGGTPRPPGRPRGARARGRAAARRRGRTLMAVRAERAPTRAGGRRATVARKTKETDIRLELNLDGRGRYQVETGIPFLNHMLELFTKHGFFDLTVRATGDLEVDYHHTVEDVGLALGVALRDALGEKAGIRRFGEATVPLDEALVTSVVDLSGRPFLVYDVRIKQAKIGTFDVELVNDFLLAMTNQAGMNLHVRMASGRNPHHIVEATFKSLARALDLATQRDPRVVGVLSTKGLL